MTDNERGQFMHALSAIATRAAIAARLGKSYNDDRDLYTALGYKTQPTFNDFAAKYYRMDIARTVIDLPVVDSWRMPPDVSETDDEETPFEKEWKELVKTKRVFHYLSRADRLASLGTFAILFLGFDDGREAFMQVRKASSLLYMMPYSYSNVDVYSYDSDPKSERYGKPNIYNVSARAVSDLSNSPNASRTMRVHHSRVIHIAEDCLEDDVEGIPRLRSVLNRLEDIEKLSGGSAEMFWRGAFPGYGFKLDDGAKIGDQELSDLQDEIEDYLHSFKRYIRLKNMSVEDLAVQVADPRGHMDVQIDLLSAATRIPKRILLGSERGELSSSQDEKNWMKQIMARQANHCEQVILRPFIDTLIKVGVLPEPKAGEYFVNWPDPLAPSDKDKAEIGEIKSKALKNYVDGLTSEQIVPVETFLAKFLDFDDYEIEMMSQQLAAAVQEEEQQAAEAAQSMAEVPPAE
jgi:hypothetical protein